MNIGFHISSAGGLDKVVPRALERHCTTFQIFSRNPRRWDYHEFNSEKVRIFKVAKHNAHLTPVFVHMPYIVNCASHDNFLYQRSIDSLCIELERSAQLDAHYVIIHAGSSGCKHTGVNRMIQAINTALNRVQNHIVLLIENTPGSGNEFGDRFEDINTLLSSCSHPDRIGMVFDTAHAFAAGYDLHTKRAVNKTLEDLDKKVHMKRVHLVHLNDSKTVCGSQYDRHEHIGKGTIGIGMKHIINHPLLESKPFIMETPRMNLDDDLRNLRTVQKYVKS